MGKAEILLPLLLISGAISQTTVKWSNLEEFQSSGWHNSIATFGFGVHYDKPSDLNPILASLDEGSTGGIWTGTADGYNFRFLNNLTTLFCDATVATLSVKLFYMPGGRQLTNAFYVDCFETGACNIPQNFPPSTSIEWTTTVVNIDVTANEAILKGINQFATQPQTQFLIDEIILTHNGRECGTIAPSTPTPDACSESCGFFRIDCHTYYECANSKRQLYTCNAEKGLAFNPKLGVCDLIENVEGCQPADSCGCEYRPNPTNCSTYFFCTELCREEQCELRTCPGGLLWSVETLSDGVQFQQCTIPEEANCASDGTPDPPREFTCAGRENGKYPNPLDDTTFFYCFNQKPSLFDCPRGMFFNPATLICETRV